MESCEIYIKDVRVDNHSYVEDTDVFLQNIYDLLNDIPNYGMVSVSVNMSQAYNVSLKTSNYDSMLVYLKGSKYHGKVYLSKSEAVELKYKIKQQLLNINGMSVGEIEIRSSKIYTDLALGLIIRPTLPAGSAPVILERR